MRLAPGRRGRLVLLAALAALRRLAAARRPLAPAGARGRARPPTATRGRRASCTSTRRSPTAAGTPEEVIRAAKATGLAFLGITDHNNLDAKPLEGYRDGVLVLVGSELSTPAGHVLGLGLDRDPAFRFNGDGLDGLEDVRDLGGVRLRGAPSLRPRRPAVDRLGPARPLGDRAAQRRQRRAGGLAAARVLGRPLPPEPRLRPAAGPQPPRTRSSAAGTRCWRGATSSASPARTPTAGSSSRRRGRFGSPPTRPSSPSPATTSSSTGR